MSPRSIFGKVKAVPADSSSLDPLARDLPPITSVLFDLDGTILDTVALILESYRHVHENELAEHTLDPDHFRLRLGVPLWGVFRELVGDDADRVDQLVDIYRAHNRAAHDRMVSAFPGVPELMRELRGKEIRTGIVTSKMREAVGRGLSIAAIEEYFDVIVTVDDVTHHKPHPEPVVKALSLLGSSPAETMYIGDAPADIGAGRAAGVRTGAVLWGPFTRQELAPHAPDHWFEQPQEILSVLS